MPKTTSPIRKRFIILTLGILGIGIIISYRAQTVFPQPVAASTTCTDPSLFGTIPNTTRVCPQEIFTAFRNPGKGWLLYNFHPATAPATAESTPLASSIYTNDFLWADLEPAEGQYRWDLIDAFIASWKATKKVQIGIMLEAPYARQGKDPIPSWVKSQIQGDYYTQSDIWEPKYTDSVFIEKYRNFLNAFAGRYYNTPADPAAENWQQYLESVDINTFGSWGEWKSKFAFQTERISISPYISATNVPVVISFDDLTVNDTVRDSFSRTATNGWGQADSGGGYTTYSPISNNEFEVNGLAGNIVMASSNSGRIATLVSTNAHDVDAKIRFKADKLPSGGNYLIDFKGRLNAAGNTSYMGRVYILSSGAMQVQIKKRVNGVDGNVSSTITIPGMQFTPDTYYWFRAQFIGSDPTTINLKVWQDGATEPADWAATGTDSDPALQQNLGDEKYTTLKNFVDQYLSAFSGSMKPQLKMNVMGSSGNGPTTLQAKDAAAVDYAIGQNGASQIRRMIGWGDANLKPDEIQYIGEHINSRPFDGEWAGNTMAWFDNKDDATPRKYTWEAIDQALGLGASHLGWYVIKQYIPCSIIPADIPLEELPEKDQCVNSTDTIYTYPLLKLYPGTNETLENYFQRRSGYRFYVSESVFPQQIQTGQTFTLRQAWYQRAVAKLYAPYQLETYLATSTGRIPLSADPTSFDAHLWAHGPSGPHAVTSTFTVPQSVAPGTYMLQFAIVDASGNPAMNLAIDDKDTAGLSDAVNDYGYYNLGTVDIVAPDITPPAVSITSPLDNASVSGTVSIEANASDDTALRQVEFYVDGTLLLADTTAPYSAPWNTSSLGAESTHTLSAKAFDTSNNSASSTPVSVSIADVTLPNVAISSPSNNATVSGNVNITASASDNVGISKVEFYVEGQLKGTDMTAPYSYTWNTASLPANSQQTLTAKAYDTSNNSSLSAAVVVKILDTTAPTVSITSPANNSVVSKNSTVTISANASDNVAVSKVEFYVNNTLKCTDISSPYACSWNVPSGKNTYTLTAKAYDAINNNTTSQNVTVTSR